MCFTVSVFRETNSENTEEIFLVSEDRKIEPAIFVT